MDIIFKEISRLQLEEMADLYMETFNATPWMDKWTKETALKRMEEMFALPDFYGICAYLDGGLCGMIFGNSELYFDGVNFNIKEFCVKRNMQRGGLGTRIFVEFEERLKGMGIKEIILLTSKGQATEGFYLKQNVVTYDGMVVMGKRI